MQFSWLPRKLHFFLDNDILNDKSELVITVEQSGPILYRKEGTKANFISKDKRTELAKKLIESKKSADNLFYNIVDNENDNVLDNLDDIKK